MSAQSLRDEVQAIPGEEHPYEGISGGAEYLHTIGYGYLGEEDANATTKVPTQPAPHQDDDAHPGTPPNTTARTHSATAAPCPHCGQLALVGVGRCACQIPQQEGQE